MSSSIAIPALQAALAYEFRDSTLLSQALTHRSFGTPHNERLEFLGDSALNCIVAYELFKRFPHLREGELSRLRAQLVREEALHEIARTLCLGQILKLGEGELKSGGDARPSILADAVEALLGAVFLEGGFDVAQMLVRRLYAQRLAKLDPAATLKDPKTRLQEILQAQHLPTPSYEVIATRGAAHKQTFEVACVVSALKLRTVGSGASRRVAEQQAALGLLAALPLPLTQSD